MEMNYRLHIPEIRVVPGPEFRYKKDTKVTVTFSNPVNFSTKIQFAQVEGNAGEQVTAKVCEISGVPLASDSHGSYLL